MAGARGAIMLLTSLATASALLPATMVAVHKHSWLPCFTPFNCVQAFNATVPTPGVGQLLVHVRSTSINPCDVDYLEYGIGCSGGGGTLGMDLSGTVVAVGPGGSGRLKIGDEVWADLGGLKGDTGAMAEYALVLEKQTGLVPSSGLNGTEAGTIPLVGLTAFELLQKAFGKLSHRGTNLTIVVNPPAHPAHLAARPHFRTVWSYSLPLTAQPHPNHQHRLHSAPHT